MEPTCDLERLPLRAGGGGVGGEVAGGGDERQRGVGGAGEQLVLAQGRVDALDGVEVAVLADERGAERRDELPWVAAGAEEGGGKLPSLVDLLPDGEGGHTVLELNGAVEFTSEYTLDRDPFTATVYELVHAARDGAGADELVASDASA